MTLATVFLIVALVLALLASFGIPQGSKVALFPLAFAFFLGALLVGGVRVIGF